MDRRTFISRAACGVIATPALVQAQQPGLSVVGFLSSRSPEDSVGYAAAFRRGLSEVGYLEGQNVVIVYRWAKGRYEHMPVLARELASLPVTVMAAVGGTPSALAAKTATATIPIVFLTGDDPVKIGRVASFNRPGGRRQSSCPVQRHSSWPVDGGWMSLANGSWMWLLLMVVVDLG